MEEIFFFKIRISSELSCFVCFLGGPLMMRVRSSIISNYYYRVSDYDYKMIHSLLKSLRVFERRSPDIQYW